MASSDVRDRGDRGLSREIPSGTWAAGVDGMHIHLHLAEVPNREPRRPVLPWLAGAAAVIVAFGVGQFTASPSGSRAADASLRVPSSMPARAVSPLPEPTLQAPLARGAEMQLPTLPPALQQQLAQPPRIVPPSPAPVVAGSPSTPPRNAFGLER